MPRPPISTLFPYTTLFRSEMNITNLSAGVMVGAPAAVAVIALVAKIVLQTPWPVTEAVPTRSEEHTSELQSLTNLVCRLLLEKKKSYRRQLAFTQRRLQTD